MSQKNEKRETVGAISSKLLQKEPETLSPIEQMRANVTEYEKNIDECIHENRQKYSGDFYVVVLTKKERLMQNVLRNFFFARQTCPTPDYDQVVYKYHRSSDTLSFMWVIPAKDICEHLLRNRLEVASHEMGLLKFVLEFEDGTLLKKAKMINGERADSNILERA